MRVVKAIIVNHSYRMTAEFLWQLVFPAQVFEWFDPVEGTKDADTIHIVFEEKNTPPVTDPNKKVLSKGFRDITLSDFPIRGRTTLLTFRRRVWQIEGEPGVIKRDIKLAFPGTMLEKEFADFLKAGSRD